MPSKKEPENKLESEVVPDAEPSEAKSVLVLGGGIAGIQRPWTWRMPA